MIIIGDDFLRSQLAAGGFELKAVFNGAGAIFFPVSKQHRDQKSPGLSYEDNYKGNALAAMLSPGRFEVRYHAAFSDREVARLVGAIGESRRASVSAGLGFRLSGPQNFPGFRGVNRLRESMPADRI